MSERWGDSRRDREALDRHITGNYGKDQFRDDLDESGYDGPVPRVGSPSYLRLSSNHPARILADLYAEPEPDEGEIAG